MAATVSFDVTSSVDLQEVDNAVNQARKELAQRYDFKGSKSAIDFKRAENEIEIVADDNFKMDAVWDILQTRMVRRGVPVKNIEPSDLESDRRRPVKRTVSLQQGIPIEAAKEIVKFLKDQKLKKVQARFRAINFGCPSPSKDELQGAMQLLRGPDFGSSCSSGTIANSAISGRSVIGHGRWVSAMDDRRYAIADHRSPRRSAVTHRDRPSPIADSHRP